jgi:hypothetical protein
MVPAPLLVKSGTFQGVRYVSPKRRKVEVTTECTSALDIFIVQASDINRWKTGGDFGGKTFWKRTYLNFKMTVHPEFDDEWYLVFNNVSDQTVGVSYEVVIA